MDGPIWRCDKNITTQELRYLLQDRHGGVPGKIGEISCEARQTIFTDGSNFTIVAENNSSHIPTKSTINFTYKQI